MLTYLQYIVKIPYFKGLLSKKKNMLVEVTPLTPHMSEDVFSAHDNISQESPHTATLG